MKAIRAFLYDLQRLHVKLWVEGGDLCYSAPKGTLTPALLQELASRKQDLLTFINEAHKAVQPSSENIQPAARDGSLPLSFAQERLWFLNQLEPDNPFYNVPVVLHFQGTLRESVLEQSLNEIIRRHEILRTRFVTIDGQARQQILPELRISLKIEDLQHLPQQEQTEEIQQGAIKESRQPFDLKQAPLFRATLLRLGPTEHVGLFTMHHIVSDGWSLGILTHELSAIYQNLLSGTLLLLPALRIQYADFAWWQRQQFQAKLLDSQLLYWKHQLAGAPPMLELPTDRPRPAIQSYRGSSERFTINATLARQLRDVSQHAQTTLFMTLFAAFATLLGRYSLQDDIVIGSPIANRNLKEIEPLIGFFVNTLALRVNLSGDPSFQDLLKQVRQLALEAYAHQDLPFEKLVDEIQPKRDLSRNPLFQVMFALHNMPISDIEFSGVQVNLVEMPRTSALFDLVLDMYESEHGELIGVLEYNTDLFEQATILRLISHLSKLLQGIIADPDTRLSALPLLTPDEQTELLRIGTGPCATYPVYQTLPHLFEAQVAVGPDRVAALYHGQPLTYAELNRQANQCAALLLRLGVGRNDFVGILAERNLDFLIAILGVLKAGGAYLPIDPGYPDERVRYMVENSQIHTLITRQPLLEKFFAQTMPDTLRSLVCLDGLSKPILISDGTGIQIFDRKAMQHESSDNPSPVNDARDRAYMLYTSGSTGLPKGAIIRHDGAINHIYAQFDALRFHADTAFLQSAPSSSDISVWQFLAPLLIGGRTVIVDLDTVCDPAALTDVINTQRITLIELVPGVLTALIDYAERRTPQERAFSTLECAMVTGEASPPALVNRWLRIYPHIPLVNAYGPTEAADDICQSVLTTPLPEQTRNAPIGKPLANLTLYIVDRQLHLQPIGVPGEICVAGIGVGEGYWRNDEKTQVSFVPNPYATNAQDQVLYRTGDAGRWLPGGIIEFIGRLDQQVKIRGFRIELGEIESVLAQHPLVRATAVIDRDDQSGEKRLAAYIVPQPSETGTDRELVELQAEQVALWEELHDNSYREAPPHADPTFNTIGWDSTYTGQPLSVQEMREYVDHTVARVLALQPKRILEIGCGTGLLLYPLAPHCQEYWGTDLSQTALNRIEASKQQIPAIRHVRLLHRKADQLEDLAPGSFDVVMLCSVVQYFPSIAYLLKVLEGAVKILKPNGAIFLGDLRSLPLWQAYHASVQFAKAEPDRTRQELEQRIRQQMLREQELLIAPAFFQALQQRLPRIQAASILPKRGTVNNELTRFRYDVIIQLKAIGKDTFPSELPLVAENWHDWQAEPIPVAEIKERLAAQAPAFWGLKQISNQRLHTERVLLNWLRTVPETAPIAQLRDQLAHNQPQGLDPEAIWQVGRDLGYNVELRYAPDEAAGGRYDTLFIRPTTLIPDPLTTGMLWPDVPVEPRSWAEYANNPLQEKFTRKLVPQLRNFLRDRVPEHMVPADFMVLDALPLLPNGKVDRNALPVPLSNGEDLAKGYVAPQTPIETGLAEIWAEVLGVPQVGIRSNFFELGGHSLKATQVISRIHQKFGVEIAVRNMFSKPTIEEFAAELASARLSSEATIERLAEAEHYPLSHAQRRLWVLAQFEGASAAYHMSEALLLEGRLDPGAFRQAFADVIARHEALRTTFVVVDGEPRQRIQAQLTTPLHLLDFIAVDDPEAQARQTAAEDAHAPFDLEHGPLIRGTLITLAEQRYVFLVNMHHIISDGWSLTVLTREFIQCYHARCASSAAKLPALRVQYRDYAHWQNQFLDTEAANAHRDYWLNTLNGELPVLNLPTDFRRPAVKTYNGRALRFTVPADRARALSALCQRHQVSLFMLLAAVVDVILYRYTGQTEILLGCPVAGRDHSDLEAQIGFYVNTLVLRSAIDSNLAFADFLQQIKAIATAAYDHQRYPFDLLVDHLRLQRDVSRSPIFDVMVVLQNTEQVELTMPDVQIKTFPTETGISQFDLTFGFEECPSGLDVTIWYNTDLFTSTRIQRLGEHVQTLFESILTDDRQPLQRLNILPMHERQQLQETFNATAARYPDACTLTDLFAQQAEATPDAVAVICADRHLTYRTLQCQASWLAYRLQTEYHVKPDDLIAVLLNRSESMISTFLGILTAGAAYVPLDPEYPADRLTFMLDDCGCRIIITETALLGRVHACLKAMSDQQPLTVLTIEEVFGNMRELPEQTVPCQDLTPDHAAYVIYTSGSTGKPKGCVITHRNVVRLLKNEKFQFDFGPTDVWIVAHSFCFDFSVWEMYGALLYGGRVVIPEREEVRNTETFRMLLHTHRITVLNQTPAAFYNLIEVEKQQPAHDLAHHLRYVIFGGDRLEPAYLRTWIDWYPLSVIRLVNMYGITETTVHVTFAPIRAEDVLAAAGRSSIGVPIPETTVYVCDPQMNLQPIGVPGEIYVGGTGVSRGYLNRPELTDERFQTSPFREGERLYKSGDLGCWREDGTLEHLGRNDFQVQLRGFRVELGEIEATLLRHPAVRKCVVLSQADVSAGAYADSTLRLVAYVVPDPASPPTVSELRGHVGASLPEYMIPAVVVFLDRIPLTANGKVDRRALPDPDVTRPELTASHVSPRTELERSIAAIWQNVLRVEQVGIHDNFFDLGGNSLNIIQVQQQLRAGAAPHINIVDLFQYTTISALAQHLQQARPAVEKITQVDERVKKQKEARERRKQRNVKDGRST